LEDLIWNRNGLFFLDVDDRNTHDQKQQQFHSFRLWPFVLVWRIFFRAKLAPYLEYIGSIVIIF
jgi:hypothetical protein